MKKIILAVLLLNLIFLVPLGAQTVAERFSVISLAAEPQNYYDRYICVQGEMVPGSGRILNYSVKSKGFETDHHENFLYAFKVREQNREINVIFDYPLDLKGGEKLVIYGYFLQSSNLPQIKLTNLIKAYSVVSY